MTRSVQKKVADGKKEVKVRVVTRRQTETRLGLGRGRCVGSGGMVWLFFAARQSIAVRTVRFRTGQDKSGQARLGQVNQVKYRRRGSVEFGKRREHNPPFHPSAAGEPDQPRLG